MSLSVGIANQLHGDGQGLDAHLLFSREHNEFPLDAESKAGTIGEGHAVRFGYGVEFGTDLGKRSVEGNDVEGGAFPERMKRVHVNTPLNRLLHDLGVIDCGDEGAD